MTFRRWNKKEQLTALKDGWILTNDGDEKVYIAKVDDPPAWKEDGWPIDYTEPKFKDDDEAQAFVKKLAKKGAKHSQKALKMVGEEFYSKAEVRAIKKRAKRAGF